MTDERISLYYSSGLYRGSLGITVEGMDADELARAKDVAGWLKSRGVEPKNHVDLGASRGYLLKEIAAPVQYGYDKNKEYFNGDMPPMTGAELVTSIHVLEHVTDPMEELYLYRALSTDKVLIEVPGINCQGGPFRFAHLHYYPPELLVRMMEAAGLTILNMDTEPNTRILAKVNTES